MNTHRLYFISDLHLSPHTPHITQLFEKFMSTLAPTATGIYIIGDFFNVWLGDDLTTPYHEHIAQMLQALTKQGIPCFFMPGNRDFLLGKAFAKRCAMTQLPDPCLIETPTGSILLSHGDGLCSKDKAHLVFRAISQHPLSKKLFLSLPASWRKKIGGDIRKHSRQHAPHRDVSINISWAKKWLEKHKSHTLIHGHIHQQGKHTEVIDGYTFNRYVTSSWEETAWIIEYNSQDGLHLVHFS